MHAVHDGILESAQRMLPALSEEFILKMCHYRNRTKILSTFVVLSISAILHAQDLLPPDADAILSDSLYEKRESAPTGLGNLTSLPSLTELTSLDPPSGRAKSQPIESSALDAVPKATPSLGDRQSTPNSTKDRTAPLRQNSKSAPIVFSVPPEETPFGVPSVSAAEDKRADSLTSRPSAKFATSTNLLWVLTCGFMVMLTQAGFAMVRAGFIRAKNTGQTMAMNFMSYAVGMLGYWLCGFAFQFGGVSSTHSSRAIPLLEVHGSEHLNVMFGFELGEKFIGLIGHSGYMLAMAPFDDCIFALFLFHALLAATAAALPIGAMAERFNFVGSLISSFLIGAVIYPAFACWVWGGGWLADLGKNFGLGHGHVDFAGSSVVHLTGGMVALVGASLIGPRRGKYNKDGAINSIPGHNLPMGFIGTSILAFSWFGFNAGAAALESGLQIAMVAVNTMLAGVSGAVAAMVFGWKAFNKPNPFFMCNGLLAGLVSVSAGCAFIDVWAAVLIGSIGGLIVVPAALFIERSLKIDDPVAAISVHGVCGVWGCLALGLFANGRYGSGWNSVQGCVTGLFYGGSTQIIAQIVGVGVCVVGVGAMAFVIYSVMSALNRLRTDVRNEITGLDLAELGAAAYQSDLKADPPP